jgi:hypothetical protein
MDTKAFLRWDFSGTLFPMKTNLLIVSNHQTALESHVQTILKSNAGAGSDSFLTQARVYAAKPSNHVRRTVLLDPVATYFFYDLILRNQKAFGKAASTKRRSFGYRFKYGRPVAIHKAYRAYMNAVKYRHRPDLRTPHQLRYCLVL